MTVQPLSLCWSLGKIKKSRKSRSDSHHRGCAVGAAGAPEQFAMLGTFTRLLLQPLGWDAINNTASYYPCTQYLVARGHPRSRCSRECTAANRLAG